MGLEVAGATRCAVRSSRSTRTVSARATSTPVSSATSSATAAASRIRERTGETVRPTSLSGWLKTTTRVELGVLRDRVADHRVPGGRLRQG